MLAEARCVQRRKHKQEEAQSSDDYDQIEVPFLNESRKTGNKTDKKSGSKSKVMFPRSPDKFRLILSRPWFDTPHFRSVP